jgi:hypothetical protein
MRNKKKNPAPIAVGDRALNCPKQERSQSKSSPRRPQDRPQPRRWLNISEPEARTALSAKIGGAP